MTSPEISTNTSLHQVLIAGQPIQVPDDLYIPPDALRVFLETFEGPLDFLLYLIKKQNIDILNIPIAKITDQYMHYVDVMEGLRFELAAEYLVMAAMLMEIKSRMLLPKPEENIEYEEDPRAELVRRLQEYEKYKKGAEQLDLLPQEGRDVLSVILSFSKNMTREMENFPIDALFSAFKDILARASLYQKHRIINETLSIRERMSDILTTLQNQRKISFEQFFKVEEGRMGVVVSFLAILELMKQALINIIQSDSFSGIVVEAIQPEFSEYEIS